VTEPTHSWAIEQHSPLWDVRVTVDERDTMRWWSRLSVGGLAAALVLAVVGGLPLRIPMPTHVFGVVEPSCGLTRGATAIARGDLALAWRYNPASFAVIAFGIAGITRILIGVRTGRWFRVVVRFRWVGALVLIAATLALWAYQQTNADFVINARL
jgi:hypothetical protein